MTRSHNFNKRDKVNVLERNQSPSDCSIPWPESIIMAGLCLALVMCPPQCMMTQQGEAAQSVRRDSGYNTTDLVRHQLNSSVFSRILVIIMPFDIGFIYLMWSCQSWSGDWVESIITNDRNKLEQFSELSAIMTLSRWTMRGIHQSVLQVRLAVTRLELYWRYRSRYSWSASPASSTLLSRTSTSVLARTRLLTRQGQPSEIVSPPILQER